MNDTYSTHIYRKFNHDLEALRTRVMEMGGLVEQQVANAIEAIVSGDSAMGLKVAANDHKVNAMEVAIDEECNRILATMAPAAIDLRLLITVIKTITDLERIGDEAERIGKLAAHLAADTGPTGSYREIEQLGDHVLAMLHDSLDTFSRLDPVDALAVVEEDKIVDEEYDRINRECVGQMMEDSRNIHRFMDISWVARSLERIGDHATNISEYVIYMVQGKDIRHTETDEVRAQVIGDEN
ncbi:MAG: phosphate signaling complex protein PhoU [Gammaproteobacteria bacterium]|nr:phosphate signaling complex protein PhoU [Gammaproteobacteria bacterium]